MIINTLKLGKSIIYKCDMITYIIMMTAIDSDDEIDPFINTSHTPPIEIVTNNHMLLFNNYFIFVLLLTILLIIYTINR